MNTQQQVPPFKKKFDPNQAYSRKDRCYMCGDSKHIEGFKFLQESSSAKCVTNMVILQVCSTRKKYLLSLEHPRCISCKQG